MRASLLIRGPIYSIVGTILGLVGIAPASAALIYAQWTFESSQPTTAGPHAPEIGVGAAFVFHQRDSTYSSPSGNGSEHSFSSTGWAVGDYLQFNYPQRFGGPAGFAPRFRFDIASNTENAPVFLLQRSLNGGSFQTVSSSIISKSDAPPNRPWNPSMRQITYSYVSGGASSISGDSISYRFLCNDAPFPISQDVNVRVDNVVFELIPEPGTGLLSACAALGLFLLRRYATAIVL